MHILELSRIIVSLYEYAYVFFFFFLQARQKILKIITQDWVPPQPDSLISELAVCTSGYCGADLKALCSEAALVALRRRYPQIYQSKQKLQLDVETIQVIFVFKSVFKCITHISDIDALKIKKLD